MLRRAGILVASALVAAAAVTAGGYFATRPTELTVAVGPPGSEDVRVMTAVGQLLRRDRAGVRLRVVAADGPAEAAAALERGTVNLAVVRSDLAVPTSGQTLAIMHRNVAVLAAPAGGPVTTLSDLAGRTVGLVRGSAVNEKMLNTILAQVEIPHNEVARLALKPEEVFVAVGSRKVDAVMVVGPITGPLAAGVVAAVAAVGPGQPHFLGISEADAIAQRMTSYDSTQILRGAFGGVPPKPGEPVPTIAAVYRLMAQAKLSETVVADFTRRLFEMRQDLAAAVPAADRIEAPDTEKGAGTPVHPGAAAYLDGDELTFFDRYGDWFYLIAMLAGLLGSIAAALAGRVRTRSHEQAHRLEHLLDIMREARGATGLATLDRLEQEADDCFAVTLGAAAQERIDTGRLSAFSLALDQVRQAIADRRRQLGGDAPVIRVVPRGVARKGQ